MNYYTILFLYSDDSFTHLTMTGLNLLFNFLYVKSAPIVFIFFSIIVLRRMFFILVPFTLIFTILTNISDYKNGSLVVSSQRNIFSLCLMLYGLISIFFGQIYNKRELFE